MWTKLKKSLESNLCEVLAGRVQIHAARYMSDEELGRIWIVFDKTQIFSVADNASEKQPTWHMKGDCVCWNIRWGRSECEKHLKSYLNCSIEDALASACEITKAWAMFDRRVGKRRLSSIAEEMQSAPLLVKYFYFIRCQAEGMRVDETDKLMSSTFLKSTFT